MLTIQQIHDPEAKARLCALVLRDLPDWFGLEEATLEYIRNSRVFPLFAAFDGEAPMGFVSLQRHNAHTHEVYCMGVLAPYHRQGVGKLLLQGAEEYARALGARFLTVKTLADAHPDQGYARTRQFYLAVGFLPLQVFPTLWGEENPCLFLAKPL